MVILTNKKMYWKLVRLWETRGEEKENFEDFLLNLCNENIISIHEMTKFIEIDKKLSK